MLIERSVLVSLACEDTHAYGTKCTSIFGLRRYTRYERSGLIILGLRRYTRYGTKWTNYLGLAKIHTLFNEVGLRRYTRYGTK